MLNKIEGIEHFKNWKFDFATTDEYLDTVIDLNYHQDITDPKIKPQILEIVSNLMNEENIDLDEVEDPVKIVGLTLDIMTPESHKQISKVFPSLFSQIIFVIAPFLSSSNFIYA